MSALAPMETLYEASMGEELPLPPALATLYGSLRLCRSAGRPCIISNFVTSLDGVVALDIPGHEDGGEISGFNEHDRMVMGLLRAVADAVVIGAGTLRADPGHVWTPSHIAPDLSDAYAALRQARGLTAAPLTVVVTARGRRDLSLPVFHTPGVPVLVVTTRAGAAALPQDGLPEGVRLAVAEGEDNVTARGVVEAIGTARANGVILVEGGPQLMGAFVAEHLLDDQFLTLAPQLAGRDKARNRPGLIEGHTFAPYDPRWGRLVDVKRARSHLFLHYAFDA